MFCYNCGNKLQDEAAFCDSCGAKVNGNETSFESESSSQQSTIDVDKVKSKIKLSANSIKSSDVFQKLVSFLTKPLTTTLSVVKASQIKEMFILGAIFMGIIIINSLISSSGIRGYYGGFLDYISFDVVGYIVILNVISVAVSTLVTALFLKIGNAEDIMRKAFGISIMTTGLYSIVGLICSIVIKVSSIAALVISGVGILLYLNLYYIAFMEHIKVSRDVKFILPVVSILVYFIIMIFILMEFIARTFLGNFYDILNLF